MKTTNLITTLISKAGSSTGNLDPHKAIVQTVVLLVTAITGGQFVISHCHWPGSGKRSKLSLSTNMLSAAVREETFVLPTNDGRTISRINSRCVLEKSLQVLIFWICANDGEEIGSEDIELCISTVGSLKQKGRSRPEVYVMASQSVTAEAMRLIDGAGFQLRINCRSQ